MDWNKQREDVVDKYIAFVSVVFKVLGAVALIAGVVAAVALVIAVLPELLVLVAPLCVADLIPARRRYLKSEEGKDVRR